MKQMVHWRNHLKFPEDTQLFIDAMDLMTKLLCDAEHRAGVEQINVYFFKIMNSFNIYCLFFNTLIFCFLSSERSIPSLGMFCGASCMQWIHMSS
jgi:hypothetical protein